MRPKITQTIIIHSHMKNLLHKESLFISELLKTDGVVQKECLSHWLNHWKTQREFLVFIFQKILKYILQHPFTNSDVFSRTFNWGIRYQCTRQPFFSEKQLKVMTNMLIKVCLALPWPVIQLLHSDHMNRHYGEEPVPWKWKKLEIRLHCTLNKFPTTKADWPLVCWQNSWVVNIPFVLGMHISSILE